MMTHPPSSEKIRLLHSCRLTRGNRHTGSMRSKTRIRLWIRTVTALVLGAVGLLSAQESVPPRRKLPLFVATPPCGQAGVPAPGETQDVPLQRGKPRLPPIPDPLFKIVK